MAFFADPRRRMIVYTGIGLLLLFALFYHYYNIFEEMKVNQFFKLVVAGNYPEAYKVWQPAPSYTYNDFLIDWGDNSYYAGGRILTFRLEGSTSKGNFVEIRVLLNGQKKVALLVNKDDKHFSIEQ
jgi:hypothetical protein